MKPKWDLSITAWRLKALPHRSLLFLSLLMEAELRSDFLLSDA